MVLRLPLAALPLLLMPVLLTGCSSSDAPPVDPTAAASAPVPGLALPPGALLNLVPTPEEVPAGMVPLVKGSGPRTLEVVAGYSGTGAQQTKSAARLREHGFTQAYVAQYANEATGQVLSVLVSAFATSGGAQADYLDDQRGNTGAAVATDQIGDASSATVSAVAGSVTGELLILRFLAGTHTWTIAYKAAPTADPKVAVDLARTMLARATA